MSNEEKEEKTKTTFWNLLKRYNYVQIPIIQRDYAQGRNTEAVKAIRYNFIEKIKDKLEKGDPLDLNFIYGSISEKNGEKYFEPIDGQQRLTTLFLLHWYILKAAGKLTEKNKNILKRFTYLIRTSSTQFCRNLIEKELKIRDNKNFTQIDKLSDEIKNNPWFSSSWINDPTIYSMLNMINTISEKFRNSVNIQQIVDLLLTEDEEKCPLFFYLLSLKDYKLDDSIYIKLNARGIALTEFENFKARLSKFLDDKNIPNSDSYIEELDNKWSFLFWNYRDKESRLFDAKIMNLFMVFVLNDYTVASKLTDKNDTRKDLLEKLNYTQLDFVNKFDKLCTEEHNRDFKVEDSIINLFQFFNIINENDSFKSIEPSNIYINEKDLLEAIINGSDLEGDKKTSYTTKIKFYAYCKFILSNKGKTGDLVNWLRIIRTLSEETGYQGSDDFARALKWVNEMSPASNDILSKLASYKYKTERPSGFDPDCVNEEIIKAKLILKPSNQWCTIIHEAENNPYFHGQIGFLFEFSRILAEFEDDKIDTWTEKEETQFYEEFCKYKNYMETFFNRFKDNQNNSYIGLCSDYAVSFRRALLSIGDYHLMKGDNWSLLNNDGRDISWKRLLRIQVRASNDKIKRGYIKTILDSPEFESGFKNNTINNALELICEKSIPNISEAKWRIDFLEHQELMRFICNNNKTTYFIRKELDTFYVMKTTRFYGTNIDVISYNLYLSMKKKGIECEYKEFTGYGLDPQIYLPNKRNFVTTIKYSKENKNFIISGKNEEIILDNKDEVFNYFKLSK